MKKLTSIITGISVICIFAMVACKKSNTTATTPTTTAACNGMNLCFKLDGTAESHNGTWKVLSNRYRVYWEETSGSNYKNIELDIYGSTTGTYTISSSPSSAGQAGFQYYIKDGSTTKNIQGQSGTVELTSIGANDITGKFTVTAKDDAGKTYEITEGNFVAVPK